jgi:threonylcarbamoyladenosine tRNA methylthiotransferase MtaB
MGVRKQRNQILRDLAARKNLELRRRFIGRTLSVVTLTDSALSDNFLKVELAAPRPANRLTGVKIGSLSATGLREKSGLNIL